MDKLTQDLLTALSTNEAVYEHQSDANSIPKEQPESRLVEDTEHQVDASLEITRRSEGPQVDVAEHQGDASLEKIATEDKPQLIGDEHQSDAHVEVNQSTIDDGAMKDIQEKKNGSVVAAVVDKVCLILGLVFIVGAIASVVYTVGLVTGAF